MEKERFKFRAWIKGGMGGDKMEYGVGVAPEKFNAEYGSFGVDVAVAGLFINTVSPEVYLMQYTGLKDKSGKEAYFNDLVKLPDSPEKIYLINKDDFGIPLFCNPKDCTQDVISFEEYFLHDGARKKNDFEIIGNIYQPKSH